MAAPLAKRKRADTTGTVLPPTNDGLVLLVGGYSPIIAATLLLAAVLTHPDVAKTIWGEKERMDAAERATVIDLDHRLQTAWKTLNLDYKHLKSSRQYDVSGDAEYTVRSCIRTIREYFSVSASSGTRKNALEALRKIGKSICLSCHDVVGHEVLRGFQSPSELEETMLGIVCGLTHAERNRVLSGGWEDKNRGAGEFGYRALRVR